MGKLRNDIILIGGILIVSIILIICYFAYRNKDSANLYAYVYDNDELVYELDLSKDTEALVIGDVSELKIVVNDGRVCVLESGCPNQICVNTGYIRYEGEIITCLPNKVYVKVVRR